MDETAVARAAEILTEITRGGERIAALPAAVHPASTAEALAVQARLVALSGKPVAGWKVATTADGEASWGAIYRGDCLNSPAVLEAGRMPLMGVEGEIAFRFRRALPARAEPYSREEIVAVLAPFPAIEIVDTRFADYQQAPALDKMADRMSNGGLVLGSAEPGAEALDLSRLRVTLSCDGKTLVEQVGGHVRGDPLLPVLDFIHARQADTSFAAGEVITAGTLTGLIFARPGQSYEVSFAGLGSARVEFAAA